MCDNVLLFVLRFVKGGFGGGMDKVGVGVEERGCVKTASLCRVWKYFQCFAIILIPR